MVYFYVQFYIYPSIIIILYAYVTHVKMKTFFLRKERKRTMKIEKMNINDLKAAEYNPRKDLTPQDEEYQHIKNSIETFGYIEPVIVNIRNNTIVGGHQRTKVLKDLGYSEVECILVDLNEQEEKAANIALNSAVGEWDEDKLQELLQEITDFDMSEFGAIEEELIQMEDDYTNNEEDESNKQHYIKIDRYEIPVSDEEYESIISNIKGYLDENGVLYGFLESGGLNVC